MIPMILVCHALRLQRSTILLVIAALVVSIPATAGGLRDSVRDATEESIRVNRHTRTYLLHLPATGIPRRTAVPLVVILHGGFSSSQRIMAVTGFNSLSDRHGFIVAYPQGTRRNWKDGRLDKHFGGWLVDDVAFIKALIDELSQRYDIDQRRIYAAGMSNGSIMTNRLGCELSHKLAAIATVAGPMGSAMARRCNPTDRLSVLHFHGTQDQLIPISGGQIAGGRLPGTVKSVDGTLEFWAKHNGCKPTREKIGAESSPDPADRTKATWEKYPGCKDGTDVVLYRISGAGHSWPGESARMRRTSRAGPVSRHIKASKIIWDFFRIHPKRM